MDSNNKKLCYCILVHQYTDILNHLIINLLKDNRSVITIHVDRKYKEITSLIKEKFSNQLDRVNIISTVRVFWGHYTMCIAMNDCMQSSISKWPTLTRITFLSGQHYLLAPASKINDFFIRHSNEQFVELFDMHTDRWVKTGVYNRRYSYYWPVAPKMYVNTIVRFFNRILRVKRYLPRNMHPYSGSQWMSITIEAARYILKMMEYKEISNFYSKTFIPDEMMFQTLLANSTFKQNINKEQLTHITWIMDGTPKYLTIDDFDDIVQSISQGKFFARKFNQKKSIELLQKLDELILIEDKHPKDTGTFV